MSTHKLVNIFKKNSKIYFKNVSIQFHFLTLSQALLLISNNYSTVKSTGSLIYTYFALLNKSMNQPRFSIILFEKTILFMQEE